MLFSSETKKWKITDFGLTSEGTSNKLITSRYARGKSCYRAPELLLESTVGFKNKVDIWSLGCIVYELYTGAKAFANDYRALEYAKSGKKLHSFLSETDEQPQGDFENWIQELLALEPQNRPSAKTLKTTMLEIIHRPRKRPGSPLETVSKPTKVARIFRAEPLEQPIIQPENVLPRNFPLPPKSILATAVKLAVSGVQSQQILKFLVNENIQILLRDAGSSLQFAASDPADDDDYSKSDKQKTEKDEASTQQSHTPRINSEKSQRLSCAADLEISVVHRRLLEYWKLRTL